MKKIMWLIPLLLLGCTQESNEYKKFYKNYNSDSRVYCDGPFLMKETFLSPKAKAPQVYLINSQECKLNTSKLF